MVVKEIIKSEIVYMASIEDLMSSALSMYLYVFRNRIGFKKPRAVVRPSTPSTLKRAFTCSVNATENSRETLIQKKAAVRSCIMKAKHTFKSKLFPKIAE